MSDTCPKCGQAWGDEYPRLSRTDDETEICADCCLVETLNAAFGEYIATRAKELT